MFCPKCATKNLDGASFCRTCGANISLVPQALTGQLAQPPVEEEFYEDRRGRRRRRKELSLDHAFKNIFIGIAFFIIAIALSRTIGQVWWFWLLIPAFSLFGQGVAEFIRLKEKERRAELAAPPVSRAFPEQPRATDELRPAPVTSVTEGTTRHLGVEAPTRHLDANEPK